MRRLKKLILLTLVPLALEVCGFAYVDKIYLAEEESVITKLNKTQLTNNKRLNLYITDDMTNLKLSYNGRYASYEQDGSLKIVDRQTGKSKTVALDQNVKVCYYIWLPDRDRLYIAEKYEDELKHNYIQMLSYDVSKGEIYPWEDNHQKRVKISVPSKNYIVKDMAVSTLTNVTYINIGYGENINNIYRVNVMSQLQKIKNYNYKVGKIGVMSLEDKFIYEDNKNNKLYIEGYKYSLNSNGLVKPCFLKADYNDTAYIGNNEKGKIDKIYYGKLDVPFSKWKKINLSFAVEREDIHITTEGKIYIIDSKKCTVTDIETEKVYKYKGKLIGICDTAIVTLYDNMLLESPM